MLPVLYILVVSGIYVAMDRYAPQPKAVQPKDPWVGLFLLGCYLLGGAIGWVLPELLAEWFCVPWGDAWLERAAKMFGALGGFMIAVRGVMVWASLLMLAVFGYLVLLVVGYLFNFR